MLFLSELEIAGKKEFFSKHLYRVNYAQYYLFERLGEIVSNPNFIDLETAIKQMLFEISKGILKTDELIADLGIKSPADHNAEIINWFEWDFYALQCNAENTSLRKPLLVSYVRNVRNIISSSCALVDSIIDGSADTVAVSAIRSGLYSHKFVHPLFVQNDFA